MTPRFVLASASPRRRSLLEQAGYEFEVIVSGADESVFPNESPTEYVSRVASAKRKSVSVGAGSVVLACDTTVVIGGTIIGKPESPDEAIDILCRLSNNLHLVLSAVTVGSGEIEESIVVESQVRFREIPLEEICRYVATGEPMDVAGGYAIQKGGAAFVNQVVGSYTNVVGLPMDEVTQVLARFNVYPKRSN